MSEDAERATRSRTRSGRELDGSRPDEQELLAAFDRLSPQDDLRWCFDDAMRRIEQPDSSRRGRRSPWRDFPTISGSAGVRPRSVSASWAMWPVCWPTSWPPTPASAADAAAAAGQRWPHGTRCAIWPPGWSCSRVAVDPLGLRDRRVAAGPARPGRAGWRPSTPGWVPRSGGCRSWWASPATGPWWAHCAGPGARWWAWSRGERRRGGRWAPLAVPVRRGRPSCSPMSCPPHDRPGRSVAGVVLFGCSDRLDLVGKARTARAVGPGRAARRDHRRAGHRPGGLGRGPLHSGAGPGARAGPSTPRRGRLLLGRAGAVDPRWHPAESGAVHAVWPGSGAD